MAITVTPDLTVISLCEAIGSWVSAGGTNALNDTTISDAIQGDRCMQNYSSATANRGADWDFGTSGVNLANQIIYFWFSFSQIWHTTNPVRLRLTDTSGNWREWNLFTKATLPHIGWLSWAVHTASPYSSQSGAFNINLVRYVGWRADTVKGKTYIFWDAWRYGTGLKISSGESDAAKFEDFFNADDASSNKYGVIERYGGVYFVKGKLEIGTSSAGIDFKPNNEVVVWKETPLILNTAQKLSVVGYSGGVVNVNISNCVFRGVGNTTPVLDFSDANIDSGTIEGSAFTKFQSIDLTGMDNVSGTVFDSCGQVRTGACSINTSSFKNYSGSGDGAFLWPPDSSLATGLRFISCTNGVEYDATSDNSDPVFDNIVFDDYGYDVNNTSGAEVAISITNGSNPNSYNPAGDAVTFPASILFELTNVVSGSRLYVEALPGGSLPSGTVIISPVTITTDPWSTPLTIVNQPFRAVLRKASSPPYYKPYEWEDTLGTGKYSRRIAQVLDE